MKRLVLFIMSAIMAVAANAQQKTIIRYHSVTKSDTTKIVWEEAVTDNGRQVTIVIGPQTTVIFSDRNYITRKCLITDKSQGTDVVITLSSDSKYHIEGTFKNKSYQVEHKSSGKIWVQNISYSVGHLSHIKGDFQYECFRPDNLEFAEMQAVSKGADTFRSQNVRDVKISPTGLKAAFWSCHYYLNDQWEYIGYRGVNGGPGTPETIMYRVE